MKKVTLLTVMFVFFLCFCDTSAQGNGFGFSVSSAGDVNGDGHEDIIVGAPFYTGDVEREGRVCVFHGTQFGFTGPIWSAESNRADSRFGGSVSSAGDVNGDGFSDVIVGAYWYSNGQNYEGHAFIWYGSPAGLGENGTPENADQILQSNSVNAQFGYSVSSAGDINHDGYSDIVVGAFSYSGVISYQGAAFVYLGSASGLLPNSILTSNHSNSNFGISVSRAGDVNGDGYGDVIIGAHKYPPSQTGAVFCYYGSATGIGSSPDWVSPNTGVRVFSYLGICVSSTGDVNNDGYDDIIAGASGYENGQRAEGKILAYYGSPSGLNSVNWSEESNQIDARLGRALSSCDFNKDGYSDIIAGCQEYDFGQSNEGVVLLHYGSSAGISNVFSSMIQNNVPSAYFGNSVSGVGSQILIGDSFFQTAFVYSPDNLANLICITH